MADVFVPLLGLVGAVLFLLVAVVRWKVHPFFALLAAALGYAFGFAEAGQAPLELIVEGFSSSAGQLGLLIVFGASLGSILEGTGAVGQMARLLTTRSGRGALVLMLGLGGSLVGISVFCDSGFVILAKLAQGIGKRSKQSRDALSSSLALGLYSSHTLIPPTPGPLMVVASLGVPMGRYLLCAVPIAVCTTLVTSIYASYLGRRCEQGKQFQGVSDPSPLQEPSSTTPLQEPSTTTLLQEPSTLGRVRFGTLVLSMLLPLLLIGGGSVVAAEPSSHILRVLHFLRQPPFALLLGLTIAWFAVPPEKQPERATWLDGALRSAGVIVLVTAAGGAFGASLRAAAMEDALQSAGAGMSSPQLGLTVLFLCAVLLKTALGSSTVALVTTAAIAAPLLPQLGLDSEGGRTLAALSLGAGAMAVSHLNDSFFWVVSQYGEMPVRSTLRYLSVGSVLAALTAFALTLLLSTFLL